MRLLVNTALHGVSRTIKADYFKMGGANAMPRNDGYEASFILQIERYEKALH